MRRTPEHPCPNCGGYARTVIPPDKAAGRNQTEYACARCGFVVPPVPWTPRQPIFQPTPLRVGMKAQIGGKDFWAAGFVRYTENDGESTSTWWEWTLLNPDGDARFLELDGGKWTLIEEIPPPPDFHGSLLGGLKQLNTATINGQRYIVREAGKATVDAVDGQIPWRVPVGAYYRYVEFGGADPPLSAEMDLSGGSPVGEAEWFRTRPVDERQVLTWFNLHEELRALDRHAATMRQRAGFGVLCILLSIASFILWGMSGQTGRVVGQGVTSAAQVPETGQQFGPFELSRTGRPYRLEVGTQLSSSSLAVQAVIENADASPSFDVEAELWDESGYDEGYWHEWSLTSRRDFRLDAPRQVYVRLYADPDAAAANAPITFSIQETNLTAVPFIWFGFIALGVGILWLCSAGASKKWNTG